MNPRIVKIGRNILFMLSIPVIIGAFVFASVSTKNEICGKVIISFTNSQLSFVTQENILAIIKPKGLIANKAKLRNLKLRDIENCIEENKWVQNANIFVSADNNVHIKVEQKIPVVRIQPENDFEEPYYLDKFANVIRYSTQYIPDLPVATSPELGFTSSDLSLKSDIVTLANYIAKDSFWKSAITQISIDENKSISLIPAFGQQVILLGDVNQLDNKMQKLFQFYQQGNRTVNWDKYDEIDLRFERQVVCRNTRGEKIAVDPYDKSTHKVATALAVSSDLKPNVAPPAATSIPSTVAVKPKVVTVQPPTALDKSNSPKTKPVAAVEKPKVVSIASKPVTAKAIEKKELPKVTEKNEVKRKPEAVESKPKITEVKESKYFK